MFRSKIKAVMCTLALSCTLAVSNISILNIPTYICAEEAAGVGEVTGDGVNVRSGAGKDNDKIGSIGAGEKVKIVGKEDGWYEIEYNGGTGYVSADYVNLLDEEIDSDTDEKEDDSAKATEEEEAEDDEVSKVSSFGDDLTKYAIIGGVIIVMIIIILLTIKSIKKLDEDDDDYYEDDYDDDEYDDDEYDDDEDEYDDDEYDDDEDEYYEEPVRRAPSKNRRQPAQPSRQERPVQPKRPAQPERPAQSERPARQAVPVEEPVSVDPIKYMSNNPDDYRIDIDPKFFETTSIPVSDVNKQVEAAGSNKEADLMEAMRKVEELKSEIERLKNEQ